MQQKICSVDVICVCSTEGGIRPLRFRATDEQDQKLCINIDEVLRTDEIKTFGREQQIFLCRATVDGRKWLFELKFSVRAHRWYLLGRYY